MKTFREKVIGVVRKIPRGQTLTYKEVAKRAGSPNAARAVGNILNKNYDSKIPCHRVIRSDGKTGGYNRGGAKAKMRLLKEERDFRIIFMHAIIGGKEGFDEENKRRSGGAYSFAAL